MGSALAVRGVVCGTDLCQRVLLPSSSSGIPQAFVFKFNDAVYSQFCEWQGFQMAQMWLVRGRSQTWTSARQAGPSRSGLRVEFQVPFLPQQGSQGGTREAGVQRGQERDRPVLQVPSTCGARFRRAWSQICSQS